MILSYFVQVTIDDQSEEKSASFVKPKTCDGMSNAYLDEYRSRIDLDETLNNSLHISVRIRLSIGETFLNAFKCRMDAMNAACNVKIAFQFAECTLQKSRKIIKKKTKKNFYSIKLYIK